MIESDVESHDSESNDSKLDSSCDSTIDSHESESSESHIDSEGESHIELQK